MTLCTLYTTCINNMYVTVRKNERIICKHTHTTQCMHTHAHHPWACVRHTFSIVRKAQFEHTYTRVSYIQIFRYEKVDPVMSKHAYILHHLICALSKSPPHIFCVFLCWEPRNWKGLIHVVVSFFLVRSTGKFLVLPWFLVVLRYTYLRKYFFKRTSQRSSNNFRILTLHFESEIFCVFFWWILQMFRCFDTKISNFNNNSNNNRLLACFSSPSKHIICWYEFFVFFIRQKTPNFLVHSI